MARNEEFCGKNAAPLLNPFTWSLRRREMFERCPREYFLHYYGSVGGAFLKTGSRQAELLHLLRSMCSVPEYVKQLLYRIVRSFFYSGSLEPEGFKSILEEQFSREFRDMLLGRAEQDHKVPFLRELTRPGFSPQALKAEILAELRREAGLWEEKALKQLLRIELEKRLEVSFPLKVCWSELDTYCTVVAAWFDGGRFNALCTGGPSEENSALLNFYALNQFECDPGHVAIWHLENGQMYEAPRQLSFSAAFRRIRKDVDAMLVLEKRSGGVDAKFFPQEFCHCGQCRFSIVCSQLG